MTRNIFAPPTIRWGATHPAHRGPVVATTTNPKHRNVLGAHAGPHAVYRALGIATSALDAARKPDLVNTAPAVPIGPYRRWSSKWAIVCLDPWGATVAETFREYIDAGCDIRPTIAVTKAHIRLLEVSAAMAAGRLKPDGEILLEGGACAVTKAAIEPVWWLPGIAKRLGIDQWILRRALVEHAGMSAELVQRKNLEVFLPPIGGSTVYIFGEPHKLADRNVELTARVHDECNGSDVFGSDICTCRPYLMHAVEECIRAAQHGGIGLVVYNRKEGRSLGEVTKLLVYNGRKRRPEGDTPEHYFECTECVAGVADVRFQELMPDVLHWLGVQKIHRLMSMSPDKYNAIVKSGIEVVERVPIPAELVPPDAQVELAAKVAAGYYSDKESAAPAQTAGRPLN